MQSRTRRYSEATIDLSRELSQLAQYHRRKSKVKLAKHVICACGLASDTVGDVWIDNYISLEQPHPHSTLYLCPLKGKGYPTYSEAWFYADCIAYEHEIPTIVYPQRSELDSYSYRYVHRGLSKPRERSIFHIPQGTEEKYIQKPISFKVLTKQTYMDNLLGLLDITRELRHGPSTYVLFKSYAQDGRIELNYSSAYRVVESEISLYSSALRQGDMLSEYLGYYRVIEAFSKSNGVSWIIERLPAFLKHDYGYIPIGHDDDERGDKPINLLDVYKRRASTRYRVLLKKFNTEKSIANYLYAVNRCGIAHGKHSPLKGQINTKYFEVGRDALIIKLLARMGIDEKKIAT